MITTVIVEDEPAIRKELEWLVNEEQDLELVGTSSSVREARKLLEEKAPDLVLLDIQLTDGTAFELLGQLKTIPFKIIFITAYNHYAIKAIKYGAMDYLLKPLDEQELQAALEKVRKDKGLGDQQTQVEVVMGQAQKQQQAVDGSNGSLDDQIVLHTMEYLQLLQLRDIVYCKSEGSYTTFILTDRRKVMVSKPLKYYEDILAEKWFVRPHQSYLLNMLYVDRYVRTGYIYLKDETVIPVSVRKKEYVLQRLVSR